MTEHTEPTTQNTLSDESLAQVIKKSGGNAGFWQSILKHDQILPVLLSRFSLQDGGQWLDEPQTFSFTSDKVWGRVGPKKGQILYKMLLSKREMDT